MTTGAEHLPGKTAGPHLATHRSEMAMAQPAARNQEVHPWHLDVLLVQPLTEARDEVVACLIGLGHQVQAVENSDQAIGIASERQPDVIITRVSAEAIDGFALLTRLRAQRLDTHVILVAESPSIEDALAATKARADYLVEPLTTRNLLGPVTAIARRREVRAERFQCRHPFDRLVGGSPLIKTLKRDAKRVAAGDDGVLVVGEAGSGRTLLAEALHAESGRRYLTVVDSAVEGSVERALVGGNDIEGGTLLVENLDLLELSMQAQLLRLLESARHSSTRIIATATRPLDVLVESGVVRPELLERIADHQLVLPPLRSRRDDLPLLVDCFCERYGAGSSQVPVSPAVWAVLASFDFPGNVRQLERVIQRALAATGGVSVELEHLPADLRPADHLSAEDADEVVPLSEAMTTFEHHYLRYALVRAGGNRTRAATLLGISRKSLWAKLKRYEARRQLLTVGWQS